MPETSPDPTDEQLEELGSSKFEAQQKASKAARLLEDGYWTEAAELLAASQSIAETQDDLDLTPEEVERLP